MTRRISPAINPTTFCATILTTCTNASAEKTPTITVGDTTVSIHYPVPASEISDPKWGGAGLNDGNQCQRMRVIVNTKDQAMFSKVFGVASSTTGRSATVKPADGTGLAPALWVLDPTGCVPLKVDGGSQVTVGTSTIQGVITVDSDGTTCTGASTTISSSGAGTLVQAVGPPTGAATGQINLVALPQGSTTCVIPACDPADVSGGRLTPQPQYGAPASRAYIDWKFNCKDTYPAFHGVFVAGCPDTAANGGTSAAYIDNLKSAVGSSGVPSSGAWTTIGPAASACSPSASVTYPAGNYYVKCTRGNNGFVVNGGVTVTFSGGNVVFEDNVTVSNTGTLNFNTANPSANLPGACTPPSVSTPCLANSSANAAFVFLRGDSSTKFSTSGTGTLVANHTFMYGGTGYVAFSGAPPTWTAPAEGPFDGLAYWTDMPASASQTSSFAVTGGSGASFSGVFFTPEAFFKLTGGGDWGQPQHAQFIAFQLAVSGGAILTMTPDPNAVSPPLKVGSLIR